MRGVSLLGWCLLVCAAAEDSELSPPGLASLISKGVQAVGSRTADAAKAVGDGVQTVGKPVSSAADAVSSATKDAAGAVEQEIKKDLQTVKQPIDTTIAFIGSSQCQNVKKLFGVSYEQVAGDKEPNLDNLELHYKTKHFTTIMNITHAAESLRQARKFDQDKRLELYVHGFTDDPSKVGFSTLSQAYLDLGRASVLALDASSLIRWFYIRAATFVRFIGRKLGAVLAACYKQGQDPAKIHVVGHSLGSHIAAFACKEFKRLTGRKVGRLTGLDPAGPCFSHVEPELRLKRDDAEYVDAIHTDAGVFGLRDPVGHKDYYPNSGSEQPDCVLQTCSHSRAWELFSVSVLDQEAFPAVRCKNWDAFKKGDCEWDKISYMGYASAPGNNGLYYLQTKPEYPYGLGLNGTKYRNTDGIVKNFANFVG